MAGLLPSRVPEPRVRDKPVAGCGWISIITVRQAPEGFAQQSAQRAAFKISPFAPAYGCSSGESLLRFLVCASARRLFVFLIGLFLLIYCLLTFHTFPEFAVLRFGLSDGKVVSNIYIVGKK